MNSTVQTRGSDDVSAADRSLARSNGGGALVAAIVALALTLAVNSLLGPFAFEVIEYRYSTSMINQAIGLDAVALVVASPLALVAAWLVHRRHRAGPVLAMGPALFAAYMMPQYVIGPDYLGLPGNNEEYALGHVGAFVLAVAVAVLAWRAVDPAQLLPNSERSDRRRAWILIGVAVFIGLGRQLPTIIGVIDDPNSSSAYLDNPTAFWLVAFLDLGVVTPAALAAAVGLRRHTSWSRTAAYAVIGWFSLVPISVAAMNLVMRINDDPLATTADTIMFGAAAGAFTVAAALLYRPLLRAPSSATADDEGRAEPH